VAGAIIEGTQASRRSESAWTRCHAAVNGGVAGGLAGALVGVMFAIATGLALSFLM
jgi:hypothetical protein